MEQEKKEGVKPKKKQTEKTKPLKKQDNICYDFNNLTLIEMCTVLNTTLMLCDNYKRLLDYDKLKHIGVKYNKMIDILYNKIVNETIL